MFPAICRRGQGWIGHDIQQHFGLYRGEESGRISRDTQPVRPDASQRDLDKLMKVYNVQENIDILHQVINDGKARKEQGNVGNDVWQENLEPRSAIAARTVPVLKREAERLKELIAEVNTERPLLPPCNSSVSGRRREQSSRRRTQKQNTTATESKRADVGVLGQT